MGVDAKAYLKGDRDFAEIEAFVATAEGGAKLVPAISTDTTRCAWIEFADRNGTSRSLFVARTSRPDDSLPDEILEEVGGRGLTEASLHADEEGVRVTRAIAERFGGWHQPSDDKETYERCQGTVLTEAERFREDAEVWKRAAEKFARAFREFSEATDRVGPSVASTVGGSPFGDVEGAAKRAAAALDAEAARLGREEAGAKREKV